MRAHVDPGLRHGDHDIGVAEAERRQQARRARRRRASVSRTRSSPVTPRWRRAGAELARDLGGRQEQHLDIGHAGDARRDSRARRAPAQAQPGAAEEGGGVLLQAALRGHRQDEGAVAHRRASPRVRSRFLRRRAAGTRLAEMRSSQIEQPTAGIGVGAEVLQQPIVAPAAHDGLRRGGADRGARR